MFETKRRMEVFSFYDHTGISAHLEKMAAKGWRLQSIGNFFWVYRRAAPQQLRYAVSYYAGASAFDPAPTEGQLDFQQYCAHTGWHLAAASAQMHVFCNDDPDATPIQTEPQTELQTIHAAAKRTFLLSHFMLLVIALLQGVLFVAELLRDPIDLLASPTRLFTGFCFLALLVLSSAELGVYYTWRHRAQKAALQGEFLPTGGTEKLQKIILAVVLCGLLWWLVNFTFGGDGLRRWVGLVMCIYMPLLFLTVRGTNALLKRAKASRGVNRTLTWLVSFAMAFGFVGAVVFTGIKMNEQGMFIPKQVETYTHNGMTWALSDDNIPLTVEDLTDVTFDGYVKERRGDESLLLGQYTMYQYPRRDAENTAGLPTLYYRLVTVKAPWLYDMCLRQLLQQGDDGWNSYHPIDPAPWGADSAWELQGADGLSPWDYLLCYDDLLVELRLDFAPHAGQMAAVGQKLAQ